MLQPWVGSAGGGGGGGVCGDDPVLASSPTTNLPDKQEDGWQGGGTGRLTNLLSSGRFIPSGENVTFFSVKSVRAGSPNTRL